MSRVDERSFLGRLSAPAWTLDETAAPVTHAAIMYFYEPFLEAFDPDLRKELGVWYTPPEIVRYQVQRVDAVLREELGCTRGLADPDVVILDPCCGTGAYLVEALRVIAQRLKASGVTSLLGEHLLMAARTRVVGFEILTAPFVIAHLQIYLLLSELGAPPTTGQRAAVFLTNALTGWKGPEQIKLHFPELQDEHDAARSIKTQARIIVVLGNPPYNRFAGVPMKEEADLADVYKGIHRDDRGRQVGQTDLYSQWHIRKHLLDDLYIRFFRLAEECIGDRAEYGIISFISNNSYLNGRSHPIMRQSLLSSFHKVWIDNLHGNRLASERTPWGDSCETVFNIAGIGAGIKVGTAISTFLKRRSMRTLPENTSVLVRDFWGRAAAKRGALLSSLAFGSLSAEEKQRLAARPEGPREYEALMPTSDTAWKLGRSGGSVGYEDWVGIDELFPVSIQGINPNRGLTGSVIDFEEAPLAERMQLYFSDVPFAEVARRHPDLCKDRARYDSRRVRARVLEEGYDADKLVQYLLFPLDLRWIYYEAAGKLLNEARPDLWNALLANEFLIAVPQPRRYSETRPLVSRFAFDLHVHDRGAVGFPADLVPEPSLFSNEKSDGMHREANLRDGLTHRIAGYWGEAIPDARSFVRQLFRYFVALCHSPQYELDNKDDLAQDWARIPLTRSPATFKEIVAAGDLIVRLLDPAPDASGNAIAIVLGEQGSSLGRVAREGGGAVRTIDLNVTYAYFGSAKGRGQPRAFAADEASAAVWGEQTGDLFLNPDVRICNVPERVWRYEIGGYPLLKKWLGYRDSRRRPGTTLSLAEIEHFQSMVKRIAAVLVFHARLDQLYDNCLMGILNREELLGTEA